MSADGSLMELRLLASLVETLGGPLHVTRTSLAISLRGVTLQLPLSARPHPVQIALIKDALKASLGSPVPARVWREATLKAALCLWITQHDHSFVALEAA
jgi:hypothetical protein